MADVEKFMSVEAGDIEKIMGVETGDIEAVMGVEYPAGGIAWGGTRAIIMGGWYYNSGGSGRSAISVQQKTLASDSNTSDFGDLAAHKHSANGSGSNGTRVVMGGGITNTTGGGAGYITYTQTIDYVTAAGSGTFGDAGDLQVGSQDGSQGGASNGTLCFFVGGGSGSSPYSLDRMEQMTISSTSGASTAGDLQFGNSKYHTVTNGDSKFLIMGLGTGEVAKTAIDEHNFSTSADSTAYGSVTATGIGLGRTAAVCATNRIVTAGGYISSGPTVRGTRMQFFPVASSADGDSSDEADLVTGAADHGATSDGTRGEWYGGAADGSAEDGEIQNDIQKVTIASLANTTDVGDLTTVDSASDYYSASDASGLAGLSVQTAT